MADTLTNAAGGDQESDFGDVLDTPEAGPRAIRGAGLRVGSYVAATVLTLVSAPLLTRHLGSVRFGQYYVVVALVALVGGLTEGGLGTIGLREYAMLAGAARERFMRNLLGMRLAFSSIGALGAVGFAALAGYPAAMLAGTAVAGLGVVIATVQSTLAVPLYSSLRIGRQVAMELLTQVLIVTLVVLGVLAGAGILPFLAIPVPAGLFLLGWTILYVRSHAPVRPAFALQQWRSVFRETYPVAASTAVQTLYLRSVILIMSLAAGQLQVGTYALSIRVMEILAGIPLLLVSTAFPILARAARDDRQRLRYVIQRMFDTGLVVGVGMSVPTMLGAGFIMSVLVGNGGGMAASVLRIQAPALLLTFLSVSAGSVLIVTRRHKALLLSTVVAVLVTAAATLALVPALGARGGAVASVLGELALLGTMTWSLWSSGELSLTLGALGRVALPATVSVVIVLVLSLGDLLRAVAFVVLYGAGVLLTRAVPVEIQDAVRSALPFPERWR